MDNTPKDRYDIVTEKTEVHYTVAVGKAKLKMIVKPDGNMALLPKNGNMFNFQSSKPELVQDIAVAMLSAVKTAKDEIFPKPKLSEADNGRHN